LGHFCPTGSVFPFRIRIRMKSGIEWLCV
jgi:hypothetical protein